MTPYSTFLQTHGGYSRQDFLGRVEGPYLLLQETPTKQAKAQGFATVKFTKQSLEKVSQEISLLPVTKREGGNAFGMMITMGRATNNDIVIPHTKVSKFHAYFRNVGTEWRISDANSRNGTYVNGIAVPGDQGMKISSGDKIKLAKTLEIVFYDPPGLYQKVQQDKITPKS